MHTAEVEGFARRSPAACPSENDWGFGFTVGLPQAANIRQSENSWGFLVTVGLVKPANICRSENDHGFGFAVWLLKAANIRCWLTNKQACLRSRRFEWWEGGARGGGPGAPSNFSKPPRKRRLALWGLQEMDQEACRKAQKSPGSSKYAPRSFQEGSRARFLCVLRGPAASQKLQGRESYVFYEVRRLPRGSRDENPM